MRVGGVQLVYAEHLSLGVGGYFRGKERRKCCYVSSLFLTRVGVYVSVCGCIRTHTHTAHQVLNVSLGVGTRHLEGPKNPDGLNLGKYVFLYVYEVHVCTYMLGGGMRSGLTAFFVEHVCPFEKAKHIEDLDVIVEPRTRTEIESELHRPSIKGTYCNKSNHHHHFEKTNNLFARENNFYRSTFAFRRHGRAQAACLPQITFTLY